MFLLIGYGLHTQLPAKLAVGKFKYTSTFVLPAFVSVLLLTVISKFMFERTYQVEKTIFKRKFL